MRVYSIGFNHTMINCKIVHSISKLNIKQYNLLTRVYIYANSEFFNNCDDILYIFENVVLIICLKSSNIDLYILCSNVHEINMLYT